MPHDRANGTVRSCAKVVRCKDGESRWWLEKREPTKRATQPKAGSAAGEARGSKRSFVTGEVDPTVSVQIPEGASPDGADQTAKPSMREVFGPGGFLEKCMTGGFDRSTVASDYEHRPGQLEMAELVHDAFETRHHAVVEAGTGTGKTLAYLLPAICVVGSRSWYGRSAKEGNVPAR